MRFRVVFVYCTLLFLAVACSPATPVATPQLINVFASQSAQPWLSKAYACADQNSVALNFSPPASADLSIRIGEPSNLVGPAYQIDQEDILVVTQSQSSLQNMTAEQVRALFSGQADPSIPVWVYASDEDIQQVFDQLVMKGGGVTSLAKLAAGPQEMSAALAAEADRIGLLPKHWVSASLREVYAIKSVPVLALTKSEPQGPLKDLIACLQ